MMKRRLDIEERALTWNDIPNPAIPYATTMTGNGGVGAIMAYAASWTRAPRRIAYQRFRAQMGMKYSTCTLTTHLAQPNLHIQPHIQECPGQKTLMKLRVKH